VKAGIALKAVLAALLCVLLCQGATARGDMSHGSSMVSSNPAGAINDFGFRLLHTLAGGGRGNVIVSPLSVSLALAMTYNGAAGATQAAMGQTLAISSPKDKDLNHANRELLNTLEQADSSVKMEIANALWAQSGFQINPQFLKLSADFYDAAVASLDFSQDPAKAADQINAWVKRETHGKIPTIVRRPDPNTRLILTDAVYFKGRWTSPFDKKATRPGKFHLADGSSVDTPMMAQSGRYPYFDTDTFQAIRLPYGNGRFAMYVFLPRKTAGLPELMGSLDLAHWSDWIGRLRERQGRIVLPRLELNYDSSLNDALKSMGMAVAFDAAKADFSRIHPPPPPLFIGDVEHKTYVKVDEEGTEAAAATSVGIVAMNMAVPQAPPFEMIVDHPFFCAVAERQSGVVLFAGLVTTPGRH
jgi:serine protease inhibitor